jgi:hypothetical protein
MTEEPSFKDYVIVSCGTLAPELNYLRKQGFLDVRRILYTTPGRHEVLKELESQLIEKITQAKQHSGKIIVVYGGKYCYVNNLQNKRNPLYGYVSQRKRKRANQ